MKRLFVLLFVAFMTISGVTYAQSIGKLSTNALAKQIASALFSAYLEIEYAKVGGKDNFELTQKIYQSEQFRATQTDSLTQTLAQFNGTKKLVVLPKINKSSVTKELISTVKFEFMKKIYQLEADKVGGMNNYTMVLGVYSSPEFKKTQKESLMQAVDQFDGSRQGGANTNKGVVDDGFMRGVLTKDQITSVLSGNILTGKIDSNVILIEYADVECPFCQRHFSSNTVSTVVKKYNLKTTFKNYPLSFHPTAQKAAEAIVCAGKQGKYVEFKDTLFSATIDSTDKKPTSKIITTTAKKLQLNETIFSKCLSDGQSVKQIESEISEGSTVFSITGTPSNVLLNTETGKYVIIAGAFPVDSFDSVIVELKK